MDLDGRLADAVYRPSPASLEALTTSLDRGDASAAGALLIRAVESRAAPAVLRAVLAHGATAGVRRSDGTPAIVLAARRRDHAAVDVLLAAGAEADARDPGGRTALMHAVERGATQVVAVLLLAGASPDAVSDDGMTPRLLARGEQWQNLQFRMGERHAGRDDVPIVRTTGRLVRTGLRVTGDPWLFEVLAGAITVAVDDLGDSEWEARTGVEAHEARVFAARLRAEVVKAPGASWHQLDATADEWATARQAVAELALGDGGGIPPGVTRLQLKDLLAELDR